MDEAAFAALHELRGDKAPPAKGVITPLAGGQAYLSLPKGPGPHPGVLVIHEWWGLNEHIKHWCDRLAEDGYAALAVDLYGGQVATTRDEALKLMRSVEEARGREIVAAAHRFLREDPRVAARKTGVLGWCFGGGWSLTAAIAEPELDACVIYYGRLITDQSVLKSISAEVLGIFGKRDQGIPSASVAAFGEAAKAAGVRLRVLEYDADHAFANPSSGRYDRVQAAAAFTEVRQFLKRTLR